jgi:hypothetical protein
MNILSKLFNSNRKLNTPVTTITEPKTTAMDNQQNNIPPVDLFIDNEAPQQEQIPTTEKQSKITVFLNRNFNSIGVNDGYEYHAQETLEIGKKKIRAGFQFIIDQCIQEKFEARLYVRNMIVNVAHISEATKQTLENTLEEINSSLSILQLQKELSAENEGWVMTAIHEYNQGFIQGLSDFISGENLLNSIKNI